jgi:HlyD family secretion protein
MKKVITILIGLIVISAFAGTLYYLYSKSETPPVVYETESPIVTTIVQKTVATGSVVPRKEVEIKPQVSGIIEKLEIEPGQVVRIGDLVARIRIIPDMVTLNNAQNRLRRARIGLDDAQWQLDRNRRLGREGAVSAAVLQESEVAFENATEELAAAESNLELIKLGSTAKDGDSSNTLVRATMTGMVLEVPVEEGDSVIEANTFNEGTTIATVANMDELIFEGKVDESEVGKIRPGMNLQLTIGAIEDERFDAVLEHIAPKGLEEDGAIQFEIRAAMDLAKDVFIRANLSANADIVLDRRDDVMAIAESLLSFDGDVPYVEIETAPQVFEKRTIETGLSDGINIEILSGLAEEDRIKNPNSGS